MNSKLLLGLGVVGGGTALAYDQGIIGGSSKEKESEDPAMVMSSPGGSPGLGAVQSGGKKKESSAPNTQVTVEAPDIETAPAVQYTDDSGGDSKKEDKSDTETDTEVSTDTKTSKAPEPPMETADSDDPMSKKVEAPGVQSEDPDQVTRELNLEQGNTRTIHDAERHGTTQFEKQLQEEIGVKKKEKQDSGGLNLGEAFGNPFGGGSLW